MTGPARLAAGLLVLCTLLTGGWSQTVGAAAVEMFPSSALFRPLAADPREAHHSMRYLITSARARGEASFGDTFGLVRINGASTFQAGVQASVYTRFNRDAESAGFLDINSADYTLFLPLDIRFDGWVLRTGVGHLSSHLGESEVQRQVLYNGANFFDRRFLYRRDYVRMVASWDATNEIRVYGGGSFGVHLTPEQPRTAVQAGAEWVGVPHPLGSILRQWYAGVDVQAWGESDWAVNANAEGGIRLARTDGARAVRVALSAYTGRSLQRLLAGQRERYVSAGFVFEF